MPTNDPDYSTTKYEYNQFGKLVKMTDPLGKSETYVVDLNGNVTRKTDRDGSTIPMTYDGLNRLLTNSVTNPVNPTLNASYSYTYTLTGNKTTMSGGGTDTSYTYNDMGRIVMEQSGNITKEYTYDAVNNRKSLVIKQNGAVKTNTTYDYDTLNRLSHTYENAQLTATYTYDYNGNRQSLAYSNGDNTDYQYNAANKLKVLNNKNAVNPLSSYIYEYNLDGNQASKTDIVGKITQYVYDGLGRLSSETDKVNGAVVTSTAYTYDDSSNRKTMDITGVNASSTSYSYDANNKLNKEVKTQGTEIDTTSYSYDDNGNQICKNTEVEKLPVGGEIETFGTSILGSAYGDSSVTINQYNGFNQLTGTTAGDKTITYTYNGDGLRTSKTVNGITTTHVWDGDQIVLELDGSGAVTNKYVRGINLLYAENGTGANRKFYLFNGHGDVVQLSGTDGSVTKNYEYDAFGNEKNLDANDANAFRYCGEYYKETGTIYLRARYYDARIGRFISEDSAWGKDNDPLSLNLYAYCDNDPIMLFDPSGHATTYDPIRG